MVARNKCPTTSRLCSRGEPPLASGGALRCAVRTRAHRPERIVGPFESREDADRFASEEPGQPERYAVVEALISPTPAGPSPDPLVRGKGPVAERPSLRFCRGR